MPVPIGGRRAGGGFGFCDKPGTLDHWPGGLVLCFPKSGAVNGRLVMDVGALRGELA